APPATRSWKFSVLAVTIHAHRFFEKQFFDSPAIDSADGDFQARCFQFRPYFRNTAELVKNIAADGIDARSIEIEPQSLAQIIEARSTVHKVATFRQWFDVEVGVTERSGVAQNVFDNIGDGDDTFSAAKFIHHDGHALRARQKTTQQIERAHCCGHE